MLRVSMHQQLGLTAGLQEDLQRLRIHLPPVGGLKLRLVPGHQGRLGAVVEKQVDEGRLAAVPQHGVQQAGGQAAGQRLLADWTRVVEVGLSSGLEQQAEAVQVVVGGADVQGTHHQCVESACAQEEARAQLVVHVHVGAEPGWREPAEDEVIGQQEKFCKIKASFFLKKRLIVTVAKHDGRERGEAA